MKTVSEINKELSKLYKEREKALEEENKKYIGKYYKYPNDNKYARICGILRGKFTLLIVEANGIFVTNEDIKDCPIVFWDEITQEEFEKQYEIIETTIKGGMK